MTEKDMTQGNTDWFVHDRFGLFVHWGLYSVLARHEWIQSREKIEAERYAEYMPYFDPDLYDPKEWARRAREAGMKYAVLTSKHHDGFAMWDTKLSDFKVTNTPAGRDVLREFVDAFRAEGLRSASTTPLSTGTIRTTRWIAPTRIATGTGTPSTKAVTWPGTGSSFTDRCASCSRITARST